jgi:hypothetical protein
LTLTCSLAQKDDDGNLFYYKLPPSGKGKGKGKQMDTAARQRFDNIRLRYAAFDDLSDAQERELFRRIQLGVKLTAAGTLPVLFLYATT